MNNQCKVYDTIIIGAGPSGVQAALYLARANKSVLVLHSFDIGALNNAEWIENFYAAGKVSGKELYKKGIKELEKFGVNVLNKKVTNITQNYETNTFTVAELIEKFEAKSIILAIGKETAKSSYKISATEKVSYCATCDGFFYKNKNVALIGDKEWAYEEYNHLKLVANSITLLSNSKKLCPILEKISDINRKKIFEVKNSKSGLIQVLFEDDSVAEFDGLFIAEGDYSVSSVSSSVGVSISNGFIEVDENMQTNIKGIFACGDAVGGVFQVAKAVNDGMKTGFSVISYLNKSL